MTKLVFTLLTFFVMSNHSRAQNIQKIDALKKLGREELIQMAVKKLDDPAFDRTKYDRIVVKADRVSLIVEFGLSIRLMTKTSCYYDVVWIALAGDGDGNSITGDCDNPRYYTRPESDQKKIDFIFDSINRSTEIGHVPDNKLDAGTTMEITEHADHYYVEVSSYSTYSHYKVDAGSGKISEAGHKHYDRDGEKEEFEIIDR